MELSFARCESILSTLPIGFYTGRRIEIGLEKDIETSFYDPMEDKIVISYSIIAERMHNIPANSTCTEEEAVRSMLYHEVSHAILTSTNLHNNFHVNCFEDERIETVLRHYYHNVNFRQQLYDIHGGNPPKAKDAESAFFNAVRFGLGTDQVKKEIKRMLSTYAKLNRNTPRYSYDNENTYDYERDIQRLWELIRKEFKEHPESFQPPKSGKGSAQSMDTIADKQSQSGNGQQRMGKANDGEDSEENGQDMAAAAPYKGEPHECNMSQEEIQRMVGACLSTRPDLNDAEIQKLNDFQKVVETIIGNFNKKNKGGSGINAYSGAFNPRMVTRPDYRFFERAMSTQGNNKFGTCHLNLIIDSSGSYSPNAALTNGILAVLSEIERKNRNFSMDVAFINHEFRLCQSVRERRMVASGGNTIPDNMKDILMKLQKPQTCNYNIVLFDGDAICQDYERKNPIKMFSVFDMKQTTLITDPENEQYMQPPFTSTKVVVTQNYTQELIDHIIRALTIAFG